MTPMQVNYYVTAVADAEAAFRKRIDYIAMNARYALLGYFAEHKLTFVSGNGEWWIEDTKKPKKHNQRFVSDDDLPKEIVDVLRIEVAHGQYLGYFINPITRKDWKDASLIDMTGFSA